MASSGLTVSLPAIPVHGRRGWTWAGSTPAFMHPHPDLGQRVLKEAVVRSGALQFLGRERIEKVLRVSYEFLFERVSSAV